MLRVRKGENVISHEILMNEETGSNRLPLRSAIMI
jgi:hypothetical protein